VTPMALRRATEPAVEASGGRPVLKVRGVAKRFSNGTLAVTGVDLDLHAGEFMSLLGPSGCGKSTLLRMIAGLGEPSAGRIEWPTTDHDSHGQPMRDVGFVFQEATLMPWATAEANVTLPLTLKRVPPRQAQARADAALEAVGLGSFRHAYPRELSGGMKMRVSLARALVVEPRLLLMDEPFAALDEITRHRLNGDLLELWQRSGVTVVFVTHSVFESVFLSQRIVVMAARPGRVSAEVPVSAPYPRNESFRTSAEYAAHCRQVSSRLGEAMAA